MEDTKYLTMIKCKVGRNVGLVWLIYGLVAAMGDKIKLAL